MKNCIFILVLLFPLFAFAQQANVWQAPLHEADGSLSLRVPFDRPEPFTALSLKLSTTGESEVRYQTAGADLNWSEWQTLPEERHFREETDPTKRVFGLAFLDPSVQFVKLDVSEYASVDANFFNPGAGASTAEVFSSTERAACNCAQPAYKKREEWCTTGNCNPTSAPTSTTVTHLIVHHSAGTGTSTNWSAIVTSIWNFHVNTNGWADIGYNWLIAPDGTVFQGRGDNVTGAHFCGTNPGTMGVCMLGTYTNSTVSEAARKKLAQILAWKACVRNLDPQGSAFHSSSGLTLKRISGHQDGCSTECPGTALYATLPALRDSVAAVLAACQVQNTAEGAEAVETIQVYPNPASGGAFWVQAPMGENPVFYLFDAFGRLIIQKQLTGGTPEEIQTKGAQGLFFWKVEAASGKILLE